MELSKDLISNMREAWGYGFRFGFTNIRPGEVYWFAVAKAEEGGRGEYL